MLIKSYVKCIFARNISIPYEFTTIQNQRLMSNILKQLTVNLFWFLESFKLFLDINMSLKYTLSCQFSSSVILGATKSRWLNDSFGTS